jgi:anti-sigma factor RsiW
MAMTNPREDLSERDEIEMLLPWYVTGKLEAADRARVEAFAASHPDIADQLAMITAERDAAITLNERIRVPAPRVAPARLAMVAANDGALSKLQDGWRRLLDRLGPRRLSYAAAAAVVLLLAQALTIGGLLVTRNTAAYQTASGGVPGREAGAYVLVRFADGVTVDAVTAALADAGVTIVSGPKPGALYRVRIGAPSMTRADREQKVQDLKRQTEIFDLVSPAQ